MLAASIKTNQHIQSIKAYIQSNRIIIIITIINVIINVIIDMLANSLINVIITNITCKKQSKNLINNQQKNNIQYNHQFNKYNYTKLRINRFWSFVEFHAKYGGHKTICHSKPVRKGRSEAHCCPLPHGRPRAA